MKIDMSQFDKEFFIKHRFWLLLALVLPFSLVALVLLATSVRASINAEKDKLLKEAAKGQTESKKEVKTPAMIAALKEQMKDLTKSQNKVHEDAYKDQEHVYFWPEAIEKTFEFSNGWFAEMIKINDGAAAGGNDLNANIVNGTVIGQEPDYIVVKDATGKESKFYSAYKPDVFRAGQSKTNLGFHTPALKGASVSVFFQKGKFFYDPFTENELRALSSVRLESGQNINPYKEQIQSILELVQPMNSTGQGQVRLGSWSYKRGGEPPPDARFVHFLRDAWPIDQDISEDVWITQENMWIQREIYKIIRKANDSVAQYRVTKEGKGKNVRYVCTNPFWKFILQVDEEGEAKSTVENLLPRSQKYDFDLKIIVGKEQAIIKPPKNLPYFNPSGYNRANKNAEDGDYIYRDVPITGPDGAKSPVAELLQKVENLPKGEIINIEVWQDLTWETTAVRRIDGIYISTVTSGIAQSHREFPKSYRGYLPRPRSAAGTSTQSKTPAGKPGGQPAPAKDKDKAGMFGNEETKTGFGKQPRERYVEVTEQLRRLPIAVVLTVEQSQVDRVQAAFNNSKLRFLTSQVTLAHSAGSLRPRVKGKSTAGDELEANLEMAIYGTVTLYERFPPRLEKPKWKS